MLQLVPADVSPLPQSIQPSLKKFALEGCVHCSYKGRRRRNIAAKIFSQVKGPEVINVDEEDEELEPEEQRFRDFVKKEGFLLIGHTTQITLLFAQTSSGPSSLSDSQPLRSLINSESLLDPHTNGICLRHYNLAKRQTKTYRSSFLSQITQTQTPVPPVSSIRFRVPPPPPPPAASQYLRVGIQVRHPGKFGNSGTLLPVGDFQKLAVVELGSLQELGQQAGMQSVGLGRSGRVRMSGMVKQRDGIHRRIDWTSGGKMSNGRDRVTRKRIAAAVMNGSSATRRKNEDESAEIHSASLTNMKSIEDDFNLHAIEYYKKQEDEIRGFLRIETRAGRMEIDVLEVDGAWSIPQKAGKRARYCTVTAIAHTTGDDVYIVGALTRAKEELVDEMGHPRKINPRTGKPIRCLEKIALSEVLESLVEDDIVVAVVATDGCASGVKTIQECYVNAVQKKFGREVQINKDPWHYAPTLNRLLDEILKTFAEGRELLQLGVIEVFRLEFFTIIAACEKLTQNYILLRAAEFGDWELFIQHKFNSECGTYGRYSNSAVIGALIEQGRKSFQECFSMKGTGLTESCHGDRAITHGKPGNRGPTSRRGRIALGRLRSQSRMDTRGVGKSIRRKRIKGGQVIDSSYFPRKFGQKVKKVGYEENLMKSFLEKEGYQPYFERRENVQQIAQVAEEGSKENRKRRERKKRAQMRAQKRAQRRARAPVDDSDEDEPPKKRARAPVDECDEDEPPKKRRKLN